MKDNEENQSCFLKPSTKLIAKQAYILAANQELRSLGHAAVSSFVLLLRLLSEAGREYLV